jgi:hypothetical protein
MCLKFLEATTVNFHRHPQTKDRLDTRCKPCFHDRISYKRKTPAEKRKAVERTDHYRKRNSEKIKAWRREYESRPEVRERTRLYAKRKRTEYVYGITNEQVSEILERQNGLCGLCKEPLEKGRRQTIDHNHRTGKVRGILHQKCNTILGFHESNPSLYSKILEYLKEYSDDGFAPIIAKLLDT